MNELEKMRNEIVSLQEKIDQTNHRISREQNRITNIRQKKDKERTHRLIVEGAELEYAFEGIQRMPQNHFRSFINAIASLPKVKELYERYMSTTEPQETKGGDS